MTTIVPIFRNKCCRKPGAAEAMLMIRRTDNGNWALPGGAVDPGEAVA
jgi:ADP-ribose pyrophosphatase YjhB (NUDIX family)